MELLTHQGMVLNFHQTIRIEIDWTFKNCGLSSAKYPKHPDETNS